MTVSVVPGAALCIRATVAMFTTRLGAVALNLAVVHKHDRLRASVVAVAKTRPIAGVCWRHLQIDRLALPGTWRLGHDYRLRDGLVNVHPLMNTRLVDVDRDIGHQSHQSH